VRLLRQDRHLLLQKQRLMKGIQIWLLLWRRRHSSSRL